jgi:hypothetical protein
MTKQDFLEGKSFSLDGDWSNNTTYKIGHSGEALQREYRMHNDIDNVLLSDSIMNIDKIGNKMIHLYTFILGRKIVDKIRYDDMVEYISQRELV